MKGRHRIVIAALTFCMGLGMLPLQGSAAASTDLTISFDENYDTAGKQSTIKVKKGEAIPFENLPTPTRKGYTFVGWYKVKDGDLQHQALVSSKSTLTPVQKNEVYYAQWLPDNHVQYIQTGDGKTTTTLGYSEFSGIQIIDKNGKALTSSEIKAYDIKKDGPVFKDLNKNGKLDAYEDWRLADDVRAENLASQLTNEEIAGLMLYSSHQRSWKETKEAVSADQISFLANDDLRHVLIAGDSSTADVHATWNNTTQAMSERFGKGIPNNNSSDPRHSAAVGVEFYSNNDGTMSIWPTSLGIAATFDSDEMLKFAKIASKEYRAFGISTALSPQIDISTDPRWNRTSGTFGEDPRLGKDMAAAYVKGFQGTFDTDSKGVWGSDSVNAMIKHWPGGGAGESGRDAHNNLGKYSIFPGNNFQAHIIPFVDGSLSGKSGSVDVATAVMPYYTISNNVDPTGTDVANAFSEYMINDLLRSRYQFSGVICTDWGVDGSRGWGPSIEDMDETDRAYVLIMAGINQFGGQNSSQYILEARKIAVKKGTEKQYDAAMQLSAKKLLQNIFQVGLFENSYLNAAESKQIAADANSNKQGFDTQVKAIVMLKNTQPIASKLSTKTKVYVPKNDDGKYLFTNKGSDGKEQFSYAKNAADADIALVPLNSPTNPSAPGESYFGGGWNPKEGDETPKGYFPLSLQYSEYTAVYGRALSIAGDYRDKDVDVSASVLNRSYKDRTSISTNYASYVTLLETKEAMGEKPVIAVLNIDNPTVMTELDEVADVIVGRFACSDAAVLEVLTGKENSTGMLPLQMPASMKEVEQQEEDVPRDMKAYVDSQGHTYDFGYGLTLVNGQYKVIGKETRDSRYDKYVKPAIMSKPENKTDNHIDDYVAIVTTELPVAQVGKPYAASIKAEGNATFTLLRVEQNEAKTAGKLPKGLEFKNGKITGTPTEEAVVQLVVQASATGKEDRIYRLNLMTQKDAVIIQPDPNNLSVEISLSSQAKKANYEKASWDVFEKSLATAKSVYAYSTEKGGFTATQKEIDQATKALNTARKALVRN